MALFGRKRTVETVPEAELVDIRDPGVAPQSPPPKPVVAEEFGRPTLCPACGHNGYLDGIDIKRRIMFQHCPACATKWDTSEAELLATS
jgi:hypothetical protein